jgi:hypothetical protein
MWASELIAAAVSVVSPAEGRTRGCARCSQRASGCAALLLSPLSAADEGLRILVVIVYGPIPTAFAHPEQTQAKQPEAE